MKSGRSSIYLLISFLGVVGLYQNCTPNLSFQSGGQSIFEQIVNGSNGGGYTGINPYVGMVYSSSSLCTNGEPRTKIKYVAPGEAYIIHDNCVPLAEPVALSGSDFSFSADFNILYFNGMELVLAPLATIASPLVPRYVQANSYIRSGPNQIVSLTMPQSLGQGNLLICRVNYQANGTTNIISGVSDTVGNSYQRAIGPIHSTTGSGIGSAVEIWYAENTKQGVGTVSPSTADLALIEAIQCAEYANISRIQAFDQAASIPGGVGGAPLSVNANSTNDLLVLFGTGIDLSTMSGDWAKFTARSLGANGLYDRTVSSAGSYGGSISAAGPVLLLSFKAAP